MICIFPQSFADFQRLSCLLIDYLTDNVISSCPIAKSTQLAHIGRKW